MRITFYTTNFCPRCRAARKSLHDIASEDPSLQIEEIDLFASPMGTWRDGIRMIPALKINGNVLSGLLLSKKAIQSFIYRYKT